MKSQLYFQVYSLRPLPDDLRLNFELPGDPYDASTEIAGKALEFLKTLGVFFYRDEEHSEALIIEPDDLTGSIIEKVPIAAYKCGGVLSYEELVIVGWERPTKVYVDKHGDDRAWLHWNEVKNVVEFDFYSVRCT